MNGMIPSRSKKKLSIDCPASNLIGRPRGKKMIQEAEIAADRDSIAMTSRGKKKNLSSSGILRRYSIVTFFFKL